MEICGKTSENKAPDLDGILNKAFNTGVKTSPDFLANSSEAVLQEKIFHVQSNKQKLAFFPKPNRPPGDQASSHLICLLDTP